jgi:hypothetical protein
MLEIGQKCSYAMKHYLLGEEKFAACPERKNGIRREFLKDNRDEQNYLYKRSSALIFASLNVA